MADPYRDSLVGEQMTNRSVVPGAVDDNMYSRMLGDISKQYGSSVENIEDLMGRISFHEAKGDPAAIQQSNVYDDEGNITGSKVAPGRGLFQYELGEEAGGSGAGRTAMNRLYSYLGGDVMTGKRPENMPDWMGQYFQENKWGNLEPSGDVDASQMSPSQQKMMFLANAT